MAYKNFDLLPVQAFIQMIAPIRLTSSVKVKLTKITNSRSSDIVFIACIHELSKGMGKVEHFHYILKMTILSRN